MPMWAWIPIGVAAALILIALVAMAARQGSSRRRSGRLRDRFGPEYDRTVRSRDDRREAEAELEAREERRNRLDIQPLPEAARRRYADTWRTVQAQFVDDPGGAVAKADALIQSAMAERGYPVEDFDQRAADVSVDHPAVVENYRAGHRLARASRDGDGSTEGLRQAMQHYRALFEELVEPPADRPLSRGRDAETRHEEEVRR